MLRVTAFSDDDGAGWQTISYKQYYDQVARAAKAFIQVSNPFVVAFRCFTRTAYYNYPY